MVGIFRDFFRSGTGVIEPTPLPNTGNLYFFQDCGYSHTPGYDDFDDDRSGKQEYSLSGSDAEDACISVCLVSYRSVHY